MSSSNNKGWLQTAIELLSALFGNKATTSSPTSPQQTVNQDALFRFLDRYADILSTPALNAILEHNGLSPLSPTTPLTTPSPQTKPEVVDEDDDDWDELAALLRDSPAPRSKARDSFILPRKSLDVEGLVNSVMTPLQADSKYPSGSLAGIAGLTPEQQKAIKEYEKKTAEMDADTRKKCHAIVVEGIRKMNPPQTPGKPSEKPANPEKPPIPDLGPPTKKPRVTDEPRVTDISVPGLPSSNPFASPPAPLDDPFAPLDVPIAPPAPPAPPPPAGPIVIEAPPRRIVKPPGSNIPIEPNPGPNPPSQSDVLDQLKKLRHVEDKEKERPPFSMSDLEKAIKEKRLRHVGDDDDDDAGKGRIKSRRKRVTTKGSGRGRGRATGRGIMPPPPGYLGPWAGLIRK